MRERYDSSFSKFIKVQNHLIPKENDSSDTVKRNYCSFGHIYSRQSSPFNTVDSIVNFGIKHEALDDGSDIEPKTLTTQ